MTHTLRTALVALVALVGASAPALAQTAALKFGYADHKVLLANLPVMDSIQATMQREVQASQQSLAPQAQELQTKIEEYQRRQSLLSADARAQREQELQGLQQALEQAQQAANQRLQIRNGELMRPVYERLQAAIDAEAQMQHLDLVLATAAGDEPLLLYVNRERILDITRAVAIRLGIQVNDAPQGATGTAAGNN